MMDALPDPCGTAGTRATTGEGQMSEQMTGAQSLVKSLEHAGVDVGKGDEGQLRLLKF